MTISHFYAGIHGSREPATRMGSKDSGISGYVQSWNARMTLTMGHGNDETDWAYFNLGNGPSNGSGGSLALNFHDVTTVVNALGSGDEKIEAIKARIYKEIEKLNDEAPKALKRRKKLADRPSHFRQRVVR